MLSLYHLCFFFFLFSGTYQDLLIIEPAIPIMVDPVSDRKKKKKSSSSNSTLKRSKSNASISEKKTSYSTRRDRRIENLDMSSAGVLFCGDQVETTMSSSIQDSSGSSQQHFTHYSNSQHPSQYGYMPFVNQEDPGYYGEYGDCGQVWSFVPDDTKVEGRTNEATSTPKRHSIATFQNCESSVRKGSRLAKSLSMSAASDRWQAGGEKVKKHRKVKKTKNGVIEDRHSDTVDAQYTNPLYKRDYYCDTDGLGGYSNPAERYIEYSYNGHNGVHFSEETNGHSSSHMYNDSVYNGDRFMNGDHHHPQAIENIGSDYLHSGYEKTVIDRKKSTASSSSGAKVRLRSDNWEWYSAHQGTGSSSSETVSTCSNDSTNKHRKSKGDERPVEEGEDTIAEKKVRKKKKSKVKTSVVVVEEEGETGT